MRRKLFLVLSLVFMLFFIPVLTHAAILVISAADFLPLSDDIDYWQNGQYLYVNDGSPMPYFYAPIHLPQYATITRIQIKLSDNSSAENMEVMIARQPLWNYNWQTMCVHTSSGTPGTETIDFWPGQINFKTISGAACYYVRISPDGDGDGSLLRFISVRIWY